MRAAAAVVARLGQGGAGDLEALARQYTAAKAGLGRRTAAERLGLNEAELSSLDTAFRDAVRRAETPADAAETDRSNAAIAALRLITWVETIHVRVPEFDFAAALPESDETMGLRQVRALELIIRSLIAERYSGQQRLTERLTQLLGADIVQIWQKSADKGDVLSGSTFGELASLFVSTEEYPGYAPLYEVTPLLTFFREKRVTIRNFLDDIRRIRNGLAHNRRVTPAQIDLLDLYYEELVEPVQTAHDDGKTKVNPDLFLDASREELNAYVARLGNDMAAVRNDIEGLRADVAGIAKDTGAIGDTTTRIETGVAHTRSRLGLVLAGIAVVIAIGAVTAWFAFFAAKRTDDTAASTARIEDSQGKTQAAVQGMADDVRALAKSGGLVADPKTPAELYHNARTLAQQGQIDAAIDTYKKLFSFDIPYADPVIDLVNLLKTKYGEAGAAAAALQIIPESGDNRSRNLARLLAGGESIADAYKRMNGQPVYLPDAWAYVQLCDEEKPEKRAVVTDRLEIEFIRKLDAALQDGSFATFYIDQLRLDDIRAKLAPFVADTKDIDLKEYDRPIIVRANMPNADAWHDWVDLWIQYNTGMHRGETVPNPPSFRIRFPGAGGVLGDWIDLMTDEGRAKLNVERAMDSSSKTSPFVSINLSGHGYRVGDVITVEIAYREADAFDTDICLRSPPMIDSATIKDGAPDNVLFAPVPLTECTAPSPE